ncbi:MAG TPA: amidase family protein [Candidatus Pacearchaeota archaeon]|jgi:aspartyl-tRNA(Asn)/glutamyl-tRNA(Gln) amidotransferase subunit A|nr:amidase family protein [Candidatus Pacearchaeota archaeon]
MLKQKIKDIKKGKLKAANNIGNFVDKISKENSKLNIVLHLNENAVEEAKKIDSRIKAGKKVGKLAGLGFLVKSNINVEGLIANCASMTLKNYKSGYNATVISKLLAEDAIVIGMVNMDEFASGSSGETGRFGSCKNPKVLDRIPGGSSSGSAAGVAAGFCDFSLGSDTGGSIRNPASHCGVVGMKPSYGMVSRYGLIDLSMSLDQIGPLANEVEDCELVFNIIKGRDENDSISRDFEMKDLLSNNKIKIGVLVVDADKKIWELINNKIEKVCNKKGWEKNDVKLDYVDLGIQTYYPIVYTEFFSGTRKFDGRKFGLRIEDSCGEEVLRRILGGQEITKAEYAGKYYRKALAAKKIIEKEFEKAFMKYDFIVLPTVPKLPHRIGSKISLRDMYDYDRLSVLANLAEIPAISIPCKDIEGIPVGLQILAGKGRDNDLLNIAKSFQ